MNDYFSRIYVYFIDPDAIALHTIDVHIYNLYTEMVL